jgi:hypothetical protein
MTDFDEFKDREFANWKRVRMCIEHENGLVNHRLSWLFTSHAFLYTAFAVVLNSWKNPNIGASSSTGSYQILLILIAMIGMFICASIQIGLWEAEIQLVRLDRWWYGSEDDREKVARGQLSSFRIDREAKNRMHPPIQGGPDRRRPILDRIKSYTFAPAIFMAVWLLIVLFVVLELSSLKSIIEFIADKGLSILSYVITLVLGIVLWESVRSGQRNSS